MVRRSLPAVAALATVTLAACQSDPTSPLAPTDALAPTARVQASKAAVPAAGVDAADVTVAAVHDREGGVIAGQYIVTFRDTKRGEKAEAKADKALEKALRKKGKGKKGKLTFAFERVLDGFAAELDDDDVAALRADPDVASVEPDFAVHATTTTTQTSAVWGLDRVDQSPLPLNGAFSYGNTGAGVTVYILDTGINYGHVEFGGRAVKGFDAVTSGGSAADCHGHGTHVAGTVGGKTYGVAKSAKLVSVRVLNCSNYGSGSALMAGMDYVAKQKAANPSTPMVANFSIIGAASATFDAAIQKMITAGVAVVVAAGNNGKDACGYSPARLASAITVGATDRYDKKTSFSNYGPCVDLLAPGSAVKSAYVGSTTATASMSGTSMATPHVAGAATLYLAAHPSATPAQVHGALVQNATPNVLSSLLTGTPNRLLSVGFIP